MMKRFLLASAALVMGTAVAVAADFGNDPLPGPGVTQNRVSGLLEMYVGAAWPDADLGADENPFFLGGAGKANFNFDNSWGAQLDVFGEGGIIDSGDYGYSTAGFGGHLYMRDPNRGALGVLANLAAYGDAYNEYGYIRGALGIEGQYYAGPFTIYGQAAYLAHLVDTCGCAFSGFAGKVEGRWFVNPNAMIALRGEFLSGMIWETSAVTRATVGLQGEMKFSGPMSAFADVAFSSNTYEGAHSFNDVTAKAGFRWYLNQDTLQDNDRTGASFTQPFVGVDELMRYYY